MPSLFIVGNINKETFANAALAAHFRAREIGAAGLSDVFVLHSPQSECHLATHRDWRDHLLSHGLNADLFSPCTVDLAKGGDEPLRHVARHVERFVVGLDARDDVFVDLTNGSSLYKSVLANVAFVLGVRRQFILDTQGKRGLLSPEELKHAYVELPDPSLLDAVAPAWLTEVRRFNVTARDAARTLVAICGPDTAKSVGFEGDIENAVRAWFQGEKRGDGAALGGAVRYVGRAFEDLIRGVHQVVSLRPSGPPKNLNDMIGQLCSQLGKIAPTYEPQLLEDVAQLLRRLRNASTHDQTSPAFGRIRARLSTELLLATAEYLRILQGEGLLNPASPAVTGQPSECVFEGQADHEYYFGLDGDDTGRRLERLFQSDFDAESFVRFSQAIDAAMRAVAERVLRAPIHGQVLFCSGDDVLFRGRYHSEALAELRAIYAHVSGGLTCSLGYGQTPKEAYVALKMAKATPGKDAVMGVHLLKDRDSRAREKSGRAAVGVNTAPSSKPRRRGVPK